MKLCVTFREEYNIESPYLLLNSNSDDGKRHLRAIDNYMRVFVHNELLGYDLEREARSAHDCRRTYASLEYLNGTDIYTLKRQLGHSTITQTEAYIKDIADANERQAKLKGSGLLLALSPKKNARICCGRNVDAKIAKKQV